MEITHVLNTRKKLERLKLEIMKNFDKVQFNEDLLNMP